MEKERLEFCVNRFDHYFESINNKGAVYLGLETFIVGGLIAAYPYFIENIKQHCLLNLVLCSSIMIGLSIMIIVILATMPFLNKGTESIFYFGSICCLTHEEFSEKSINVDEKNNLEDLRRQVYHLSHGLQKKFKKLKLASLLFIIQFLFFIPLIFLIILNQ
mgnify:CR=1 FL=1